jgi:hypothetical protein
MGSRLEEYLNGKKAGLFFSFIHELQ